jgi:hypothetical protein
VKGIESDVARGTALSELTQALAYVGDRETAARWVEQALAAAEARFWFGVNAKALLGGVAQALAHVGDVHGLRRALEVAEGFGDEGRRATALSGVTPALAQLADMDGLRKALAAAEGIRSEKTRAKALSGVGQALAQVEQADWGLDVFVKAFRAARYAGRDSVFSVLGKAAHMLAGIEDDQVLGQVYDRVMEVESWWGA